jgi:hypothetical protein
MKCLEGLSVPECTHCIIKAPQAHEVLPLHYCLNFSHFNSVPEARGSTMLQAGRSRVRFPMRSLDLSIALILSDLVSNQFLTKMSTRNLPGGKGRPKRKADLTAICESII